MSAPSDTGTKSPLDAAQKIVSELAGMTPEHQLLALRFSMETLGLRLPTPLAPIAAPLPHPPQEMPPHTAPGADHSTDIRSFTAMKSPKSDQQFTAVVAYFYQFEAKPDERKDSIDAEIMKEAARLAGRPQVSRWNMTLTNAKNAGYLDAAGGGKFKLSSVGENLVAITLPGNGSPSGNKGHAATKKPKKKPQGKNTKKKG
ncbi:hypothetical protein L6654_10145 [Bradyrhizobium sp. WYCCWR 13023]|uniref:Uncharacterized protein n=1 Tax=Bradyrhizobium zhengyangense TaxID=2911009 RepID=A0A9X1U6Q4_9BRAD|nr:hypothetical protein [Bradyrhizobium zhengyangense]MCG2626985.1 hypothetical protein [Bradyrhizobium zhengyangense]